MVSLALLAPTNRMQYGATGSNGAGRAVQFEEMMSKQLRVRREADEEKYLPHPSRARRQPHSSLATTAAHLDSRPGRHTFCAPPWCSSLPSAADPAGTAYCMLDSATQDPSTSSRSAPPCSPRPASPSLRATSRRAHRLDLDTPCKT